VCRQFSTFDLTHRERRSIDIGLDIYTVQTIHRHIYTVQTIHRPIYTVQTTYIYSILCDVRYSP
jgi:hypothetical protein